MENAYAFCICWIIWGRVSGAAYFRSFMANIVSRPLVTWFYRICRERCAFRSPSYTGRVTGQHLAYSRRRMKWDVAKYSIRWLVVHTYMQNIVANTLNSFCNLIIKHLFSMNRVLCWTHCMISDCFECSVGSIAFCGWIVCAKFHKLSDTGANLSLFRRAEARHVRVGTVLPIKQPRLYSWDRNSHSQCSVCVS